MVSAKRTALLFLFTCLPTHGMVLWAQCKFKAEGRQRVTYAFAPEVAGDRATLHVSLTLRMGPKGTETLVLPTEWAGEVLKSFTNLNVATPGAFLQNGGAPSEQVLHGSPWQFVTITYDLLKDWNGPFKNPLQFHPIINPQYLEFTGSNGLVRVAFGDNDVETANFDWSRLPQGWSLATSFDGSRNASKRCQTVTAPWREIYGALYAAGDFRLVRFNIAGKPAVLAVRGNWDFTDVAAANDIKRTVGMVRKFWHDNRFPRFLVTLAPYDQEHGSSDGSAFTNAFWMFVSNRDQIRSLLPQLAHESFHAWDPKRMGTIPLGYDERNIRWFNEGTTEYYAQLLTLRAGLLPMPTYISSLNEDLRRFPDSSDEYVRGRIISLWLDGTIRTQSHNEHSLDDVMFDMVKGSSRPYTFERLLQTIDHYLNEPTQLVLRLAILQQGDVAAPAQAPYVGACAFATQKSLPTFDLGFDLDSSRATMTVSGVKEGGPAFTAGLRDGQKLKGFSFAKWDSDKLASVRVSSASGEQRYSFYPRGRLEDVWQYETVPNANCAITSKQ